ncbi:MAG TPA: c-type cytochrome [Planctomycetaceae bacterium]|nr:c-type cytochrome [Planctomycetaceae bacterium]
MKSFLTCLIACGMCATAAHAAEPRTGEQIYKQLCANCHGPNGEGTEEHYPQGLVGDQSIGQLASLITRTMPLKAPEKCVGEDARAWPNTSTTPFTRQQPRRGTSRPGSNFPA